MKPIDKAFRRGAVGAARAAGKAGDDWKESALLAVIDFAEAHPGEFCTAEIIRGYAETRGLDEPPDRRAWGHVFIVAARQGLIVKAGYAPTVSSNGSPKVLWQMVEKKMT